MPIFSAARHCFGEVKIPVMVEIVQNILFQKCLQAQNILRRLLTEPQFLQHSGKLVERNLDIL